MLDDSTAAQIRELAGGSHRLEADVRNAILRTLLAETNEAVGAKEIFDLAEAFAWRTNPRQAHGGPAS